MVLLENTRSLDIFVDFFLGSEKLLFILETFFVNKLVSWYRRPYFRIFIFTM